MENESTNKRNAVRSPFNRYFKRFEESSFSDGKSMKLLPDSKFAKEDEEYLVNRSPTTYGDLPAHLFKYKESYKVRWQKAKFFFSNERTFLSWLNAISFLTIAGVTLLTDSSHFKTSTASTKHITNRHLTGELNAEERDRFYKGLPHSSNKTKSQLGFYSGIIYIIVAVFMCIWVLRIHRKRYLIGLKTEKGGIIPDEILSNDGTTTILISLYIISLIYLVFYFGIYDMIYTQSLQQ